MTNYKSTLNLPNTKFSMRGNLTEKEPQILKRWHEQNLYDIIRQVKKGKKIFILHDGPPYANGGIHIGHAVNKILKDIIIKSKLLTGYDSPYIAGWDCHGLPIELKVEQLIGKAGQKVSAAKFREVCRTYVTKQVEKQKKDFIRLGVLSDWQHPYLTMDFSTEANIIRTFGKIATSGYLYKGKKPTHWCTECRSALAEAEIEYHNRSALSIDVAFKAKDTNSVSIKFGITNYIEQIYLLVWTTTPWTLPANRAIAIHPEFNYQLIEIKGKGYILSETLLNTVMKRFCVKSWKTLGVTKGNQLESLWFCHPFMNFNIPTIFSQNVTSSMGTGAVHIAPGHGLDDYIVGKKYNLEIFNSVGSDGCYLPNTHPSLDGLSVLKSTVDKVIINLLYSNDALMHAENLIHSYPHCWRHKTPVIFRTTPQWFISMEQNGLRRKLLKEAKKVKWAPQWSQTCIEAMITNRPDWCISRQRVWAIPLALFVHKDKGTLHPRTTELIEDIAKRVEKIGVQAWWDLNLAEILGDDADLYYKVPDTLDVWFDSGSTYSSVLEARPEFKNHLPDMCLEGSDQHRGWFMSSLIISTSIHGKAPYRHVLTHGFIVDGKGRKMSKSTNNVISPQVIVNKLGADILRLWVASTDYTREMSVSNEILTCSVNSYRKIRNTARFLLSNLNDFIPTLHSISPEAMIAVDRWAVSRTQAAQEEIISSYEEYNFHNVIKRLIQFCSVEMSSFYLDIIKDRQYTSKKNSIARRSCQTAMYHIIEALVRWIAPIIPFTADEIWSFIPERQSKYVFTEEWYNGLSKLDATQLLNDAYWETLLKVRNAINKVIEQARVAKFINSSLEACITLYAEPIIKDVLSKLDKELHFALLTSDAIIADYNDATIDAIQCEKFHGLKIALKKANGEKCPRCWHYTTNVNQYIHDLKMCNRCVMNVSGLGEIRKFV
ncbi:isoleucine--tRNA ligase [Sodalis sp. CWE]|uniref:isoleucine--tRNA ligase n=1 Tax=Sodalis sp. CWE TaxID=2803816 RepID=UPI001C7D380F|nr:isoleucine--tRNA ligase [Sodalis sp. CWE]MBX4180722.1 isoleucine--tRNA ligase [Sodalis sp. CWE]